MVCSTLNYWSSGLCPSSENKKKTRKQPSETWISFQRLRLALSKGPNGTGCVFYFLEFWTMDKVQNLSNANVIYVEHYCYNYGVRSLQILIRSAEASVSALGPEVGCCYWDCFLSHSALAFPVQL
jgi:hypothetical protein